MERLTIKSTGGAGYALALDDPQNEQEARKQLMDKFKVAVNKLAEFEDFMEENEFGTLCDLKCAVDVSDVMGKLRWQTAKELEAYKKAWGELKGYFAEPLWWTQDMIEISRGAEYEQCREDALKKMHELAPKGEDDE